MFQSVIDDIKAQFSYGNMVTKIILVNLFVFLFIIIVKAFTPAGSGVYDTLIDLIALPSDGWKLLKRPWTIFTYMFLHEGVWHFAWNMIMLYWFGRILGDLMGDKRMLPLYILGGLAGALMYIIYVQISGTVGDVRGASAAVSCIIVTAALVAPDYNIRLLLIGNVRLKYIALALFFLDLVSIAEGNNVGGNFTHIGGAIMAIMFIYMLRKGMDFTKPLSKDINLFTTKKKKQAPMKVVHNKKFPKRKVDKEPRPVNIQERIDEILDKINVSGYDSLNSEEKDFLYKASKNS